MVKEFTGFLARYAVIFLINFTSLRAVSVARRSFNFCVRNKREVITF